jgi:hypothetical protein
MRSRYSGYKSKPIERPGSERSPASGSSLEKHYSVTDLAQLWSLSEKTIRRIFVNEPGVVKWGHQEQRFKRGYFTLRIPESVIQRVHRRLTQPEHHS